MFLSIYSVISTTKHLIHFLSFFPYSPHTPTILTTAQLLHAFTHLSLSLNLLNQYLYIFYTPHFLSLQIYNSQ